MTDGSTPEAAVHQPGQRTVGRNAVETVVFRLFTIPVGLATVIVTTRYLLPSGRGAYVWAILTASLMVTFVGNIGSAYANAFRAKRRGPDALLRVALLLSLAVGVVAGVALVPIEVALAPNGYPITFIVAISVPALVVAQTVSGALLVLGRTRTWNVIQALPPTVGLVAL